MFQPLPISGDTKMNSMRNRFGALLVVAGAMALNGVAMGQVGQVIAWGDNGDGQCNVPDAAKSGVSAIAGGYSHVLALKNGEVLAWGWNTSGLSTIPTAAQSGVSAIACGFNHSLALKNGAVLAWGVNGSGQCDVPDAAKSGVTAIAAMSDSSAALKNGCVLVWGSNGNGQLDIPVAAQSGVTAIACGASHIVALKGGSVLVWGSPWAGQYNIPIEAQSGVTAIAAKGDGSIALKNGSVLAWGRGPSVTPGEAQSGVTAIAKGWDHNIVLKNGAVLAWGANNFRQCDVPISATSGVTAIACGYDFSIALKCPPVTITGVIPISGPSSGNTNITITGTNFFSPTIVTIGGTPATNVIFVSDTQITATTPAGFPGPAEVTVNSVSSTAFYYRPSCASDIDNNGVVDNADLGILLLDYGSCSESAAATEPLEPVQIPMIEQQPKPLVVKR